MRRLSKVNLLFTSDVKSDLFDRVSLIEGYVNVRSLTPSSGIQYHLTRSWMQLAHAVRSWPPTPPPPTPYPSHPPPPPSQSFDPPGWNSLDQRSSESHVQIPQPYFTPQIVAVMPDPEKIYDVWEFLGGSAWDEHYDYLNHNHGDFLSVMIIESLYPPPPYYYVLPQQ